MKTEEIIQLCHDIRRGDTPKQASEWHVELIGQLATELRETREAHPGMTSPPVDQVDRLQVVGWLMYEVSLQSLRKVSAGWEGLSAHRRSESSRQEGFITQVANAARFLPWREFSPRALGAIRAQAVAFSKRDTDAGYTRAWLLHREADFLHDLFSAQVRGNSRLERGYLESIVQLRLAETGTACRTAEFAISLEFDTAVRSSVPERAKVNKLFRDLESGTKYGEEAIENVTELHRRGNLVQVVDEQWIALDTSFRNPGIMTARAYLLMYPVSALLEKQGRRPWQNLSTWAEARKKLLEGFERAYRAIETPSSTKAFTLEHQRSIAQLRLNLALICPGYVLPSRLSPDVDLDPRLLRCELNDDAINELSEWLAEDDGHGRQRGDANVIGSATMPSYLQSIRLVLDGGGWERYVRWRDAWFHALDRYAAEPERKSRVREALDMAAI